jgi:hypothetical protein
VSNQTLIEGLKHFQVLQTNRRARIGGDGSETFAISFEVAARIQHTCCVLFEAGRSKKGRMHGETEPLKYHAATGTW